MNVLTSETEEIGSSGVGGPGGAQGGRFGAVTTSGMGYMGLGGYIPKPLSARLAEGELLLAKDINTQFINDEGQPLEKNQIPWQTAPEAIGYSYPYILALQAPVKGTLEVRNPQTLSLLQTISLPGAAQLHPPPPMLSLAQGKGFHASSERCVWKMGATDYDSQIKQLVEAAGYDEAISILDMLEDALLRNKAESLRETKMLKAEKLFRQKQYRKSLDLFNDEDVHAPPERVLRLFPPLIAGGLSAYKPPEVTEEPEAEAADGTNGTEPTTPEPSTPYASSPARGAAAGGGGFVSMFMGGRRQTVTDDASTKSPRKESTDSDDAASIKPKPSPDGFLEGQDLTKAVLELNSYLAGTRARLQRVIDPATGKLKPRSSKDKTAEETLKALLSSAHDESDLELEKQLRETFTLVDTTLFRAYMFSRPTLAGSLFRIPNFCDPEVVNEKLVEHNRFTELVDFFYGKKLHAKALELLHRFGAAEGPDEAAPALHGPQRTISYLQNLPPSEIDLVLKYAEWALRASPDLAMEIFVTDTENAETLPRARVVSFLSGIDPSLEIRYLEHIIMELDDMTPEFHNRLVELLIQHLKDNARGDEWDSVMEKLIKFLPSSRQYSLSRAFGLIPRDGKFKFK